MDGIVNSIMNGCSPRVPIDVGIENIDGKSVIAVEVMGGSKCPYFVKSEGSEDGVYVRVGATTQRADDETRRELALASEGRSFDCEPCPKAKIDEKRIKALCAKMYRTARANCDTEEERRTFEDVGFAVRMNVYRNNVQGDEAVKSETASKKQRREVVSEVVNEVVSEVVKRIYDGIKRNPGIRKPKLLQIVKTSRATAERAIAQLQGLRKIEFRGAPKTGGYYCI